MLHNRDSTKSISPRKEDWGKRLVSNTIRPNENKTSNLTKEKNIPISNIKSHLHQHRHRLKSGGPCGPSKHKVIARSQEP
ncbi:hypothetical protein ACN38_g6057 [Penicillium nordicum]|uniref:Uncharacterized protein n=1 Tax=Penicillium nordicum TaxID=229535 RepID=A0A0N0RYT3_9EURO|nr:hypothetical protein ACN38_g6057 [Penicillium nordicum]